MMGEQNLITRRLLNAHNVPHMVKPYLVQMYSKNKLCRKLIVVHLRWSVLMIWNLENEKPVKQQLDPLFCWASLRASPQL